MLDTGAFWHDEKNTVRSKNQGAIRELNAGCDITLFSTCYNMHIIWVFPFSDPIATMNDAVTGVAPLWRPRRHVVEGNKNGEHRESNSGPPLPESGIIPLDHVPRFLGELKRIDGLEAFLPIIQLAASRFAAGSLNHMYAPERAFEAVSPALHLCLSNSTVRRTLYLGGALPVPADAPSTCESPPPDPAQGKCNFGLSNALSGHGY